jgi:hypothetical protein
MSYSDDPELDNPAATDDPSVQHYAGYCLECDSQLGDPMTTVADSQNEVDLHLQHNPEHKAHVSAYPFHSDHPGPVG